MKSVELVKEILQANPSEIALTGHLPDGSVILLKDLSASLTMTEHLLLKKYGKSAYYEVVYTERGYRIIAKAGMIYDMASVPNYLQWFLRRDRIPEASTIHDALYNHIRTLPRWKRKTYRKIADSIFKRHLSTQEPRLKRWRQYVTYIAVRVFGRYAIKTKLLK